MSREASATVVTWGVALLAALFAAGVVLVPVGEAAGIEAASWLRLLYARLCHQLPERSLVLEVGTLAVCARCAGLYAGGVAGLVLGALARLGAAARPWPRPAWFWLAVGPTVADGLLAWTGLPSLPDGPRALVAVPAGLAAGVFLAAGVRNAVGSASAGQGSAMSGVSRS